MPFNGSGVYELPLPAVVGGTTVASSWANTTMNDIKSALSSCLVRDGQGAMSGNLQMGSQKITGIAGGSSVAPTITFATSATTGLFSPVATQVGIASNGVSKYLYNGTHNFADNVIIQNNLNVTGSTSFGPTTVNGNESVTGDLGVTGKSTSAAQPNFFASLSGTNSNGAAFANYAGVARNVGSGFNATTGIFTAPVTGVYVFNAHMGPNGGTGITARIIVNGVEGGYGSHVDNSGMRFNVSAVAYLAAGQTAYVLCNISAGITQVQSFQGCLIA